MPFELSGGLAKPIIFDYENLSNRLFLTLFFFLFLLFLFLTILEILRFLKICSTIKIFFFYFNASVIFHFINVSEISLFGSHDMKPELIDRASALLPLAQPSALCIFTIDWQQPAGAGTTSPSSSGSILHLQTSCLSLSHSSWNFYHYLLWKKFSLTCTQWICKLLSTFP